MSSIIPTVDPNASGSDTDDSDFAASDSYGSDYDTSSSEKSASKPKSKRTPAHNEEALASGDEGVVESGQRKRKRKHQKEGKGKRKDAEDANGAGDGSDEEEGVGARLRRRREGKAERETKKKPLGSSEAATANVDDLWQRLASAPVKPTVPLAPSPPPQNDVDLDHKNPSIETIEKIHRSAVSPADASDEMITIKRTYNFAGETTTEEKLVPRESAEARLYLSSKSTETPQPPPLDLTDTGKPLRRPLKRPSRFDNPNPATTSLLQTTATIKSHLAPTAVNAAGISAVQRKLEQGQKLNTVEKSRLDWAGYVDKEKLKDELDVAEKAKGSYLDRMEFLGRSDQARDDLLREGRRK